MPTRPHLHDREIQDYYESQQLARESLVDAISKLRKRNRRADGPGEVAENDAKILDLKADKALLDAKRLAFEAGRHAITPPTAAQLDRLAELVNAVEAIDANNEILKEVIDLTRDALSAFKAIHPDQA